MFLFMCLWQYKVDEFWQYKIWHKTYHLPFATWDPSAKKNVRGWMKKKLALFNYVNATCLLHRFKFKVAGQAIFPIKLTWRVKILTFCFWINSKQKELNLFGHLTMEVNFINFYIHVFTFISNIHGDIKDSKVGSIQDSISCNHGFLFRWPECYS